MPKRIPQKKREAILDSAGQRRISQRELAERFGVARGTVASILRESGEQTDPQAGEPPVKFRVTSQYYCEGCKTMVSIRPCPACLARRAQANGAKSVIAGMRHRETNPARPRLHNPDDALPEVPEAVGDWLDERLSRMIGPEGFHADVDEAIEELSREIRRLIESVAGVIGEARRSAHVKRGVASKSSCSA